MTWNDERGESLEFSSITDPILHAAATGNWGNLDKFGPVDWGSYFKNSGPQKYQGETLLHLAAKSLSAGAMREEGVTLINVMKDKLDAMSFEKLLRAVDSKGTDHVERFAFFLKHGSCNGRIESMVLVSLE